MNYKLTVLKYEDNPEYEAQMAAFKASRGYNYNHRDEELPSKTSPVRALEVILTDKEYDAIKKAVMATFDDHETE